MKIYRRIFTLLVTVLFLCLSMPFAASATPAKNRFGRSVLQQMAGGSRLVAAYDALAAGVERADENISLPGGSNAITVNELKSVGEAILADYPEFFWIGSNYSYSYENTAPYRVITVKFSYTMTGTALTQAKTQFNNKLNELTQGLSGKSDYEISKILHDRVAAAVTYDLSVSSEQDAYGALVKGKAVCAGYARAYQCLMLKMGIETWYVSGMGVKPSTGSAETHAWNLVKLDGQWYYTDVTWDDQGQTLHYTYLNQTWARISEDHTVDVFAEYLPKSTATANNYFIINGGMISTFDAATVAQRLQADGMTTRLYVTGNMEAFKNALNLESNIRAILKALGRENAGYSYYTQTLGREIVLTLNIIEASHRHQLSYISEQSATCHRPGRKAYYTCSCGKWFSDSGAVNEISDKESLTIPALTHTPSSWQSDAQSHWKVCTRTGCGMEIVNSRAAHADGNSDGKCDTCSAAVAKQEAPPTPTNPATQPTQSTIQPTQPAVGESEPVSEPTASTGQVTQNPSNTTVPEASAPGTEALPTDPHPSAPGLSADAIWGLIGAGIVIVVLAGTGVLVFIMRRRA